MSVEGISMQSRPEWLGLATLMFVQLGFWIGLSQAGEIAGALADTSSLWPVVIASAVGLAAIFAGVWALLRRYGLEPSPVAKFGLAYVGLALSCTALASALEFSRAGTLPSELVIFAAVLLGGAAAIIGPAAVAAVLQLARPRLRVAGLGAWLVTLVLGRWFAGWTRVPVRSSEALFDACLTIGFVAVGIAVLSSLLWRSDDDADVPLGGAARPLLTSGFVLRAHARVRAPKQV